MRYIFIFWILFFGIVQKGTTQVEQTVEATISLEASSDLVKVSALVYNTERYIQSLRCVLSVNVDVLGQEKPERTVVENRFVLNELDKKVVAETNFLPTIKERIILLLLIYNNDDEIVGRKRIVLNENANKNTGTGLELKEQFVKELAKTKKVSREEERDGLSLTGLVFEDTRTKPGSDFYKLFYSRYLRNSLSGPENVLVREVIATGRNTRIEVLVGRRLVWQFFSRPQNDYLVAQADQAIRRVNYQFQQLKKNNVSTSY